MCMLASQLACAGYPCLASLVDGHASHHLQTFYHLCMQAAFRNQEILAWECTLHTGLEGERMLLRRPQ